MEKSVESQVCMHSFRVFPFAEGASKVSGFPRYFLISDSHAMPDPLHAYKEQN